MAKTKSVTIQMKEIMDEFDEKVNKVLNKSAEKVSMESANKLQNTSPKKSGGYQSGWTVKHDGKKYIVYNEGHYQLTHLLENGHVIRNRKGTYGRTSPKKHIKPVETWANKEFQREIEQGLSR